jgi:hypothetical protein
MDIRAFIGVVAPQMMKLFEETQSGEAPRDLDKDEMNAALAQLPDQPEEDLP